MSAGNDRTDARERETLRRELVRTWGEASPQVLMFDRLLRERDERIRELQQQVQAARAAGGDAT